MSNNNPMLNQLQPQPQQQQSLSQQQQPLNNDMLSAINQNAPQLKQAYQAMQGKNPMEVLQKMGMQNNPMLQSMMSGGMNAEQMVQQLCQQQGIDAGQFLQQLQNAIK